MNVCQQIRNNSTDFIHNWTEQRLVPHYELLYDIIIYDMIDCGLKDMMKIEFILLQRMQPIRLLKCSHART